MTVVVASRNRRRDLLASLPRHRARTILVDNASTDGSADAVSRAFPGVEVVRLRHNIGAAARTVGLQRVRTPWVAFADDDSWWRPGSLTRGADLLARHPQTGLLNARILVGPQQRLDPISAQMSGSPLPRVPSSPGPAILGFVACGAIARTDALRAAGGFDDLIRFPGEEERLSLDLAALGWAQRPGRGTTR